MWTTREKKYILEEIDEEQQTGFLWKKLDKKIVTYFYKYNYGDYKSRWAQNMTQKSYSW